jgi:NADH dehydrogenase
VLPRVALVNADVHDRAVLARELAGADAAVNLVGILNERGSDGNGFRKAHVELTRTLLDACAGTGVSRLLQMSALRAGEGTSHYLQTRAQAEALVQSSPLAWTIFRPSVIFGDGDGLFFRFASLLRIAPMLPIARAQAKFQPVHVGDVAEAFARALVHPHTAGHVYELGGPEIVTLRDVVDRTARMLGKRRLVLPLPDALGFMQACIGEWLPGKPISRDNYRSLGIDSVAREDGLGALGIVATPIDAIMPRLLAEHA